jgi:distribution and morphology protein 10
VGVVDGSVSYLYSSLPLQRKFKSSDLDLQHAIRGYRHLQELRRPDEDWWWEIWHSGKRIDRRGMLNGTRHAA